MYTYQLIAVPWTPRKISGLSFFSIAKQFMSDKQGERRSDRLTDGLEFHLKGSQTQECTFMGGVFSLCSHIQSLQHVLRDILLKHVCCSMEK